MWSVGQQSRRLLALEQSAVHPAVQDIARAPRNEIRQKSAYARAHEEVRKWLCGGIAGHESWCLYERYHEHQSGVIRTRITPCTASVSGIADTSVEEGSIFFHARFTSILADGA